MLLALNKAFLYLNCQPRIFRKVPQASLSVCTKNYAPVYKHGWMQNHKRTGPNSTLPGEPRARRPAHPAAPSGGGSLETRPEQTPPGIPKPQGGGKRGRGGGSHRRRGGSEGRKENTPPPIAKPPSWPGGRGPGGMRGAEPGAWGRGRGRGLC